MTSPNRQPESDFGSMADICLGLEAPLAEIVSALSVRTGPRVGSGVALVLGEGGELAGVITDADLRRGLTQGDPTLIRAKKIMKTDFFSVQNDRPLAEAFSAVLNDLEEHKWTTENPAKVIPVLGTNREPLALIEMSGREREALIQRDIAVVVGQGFVGLTLSAVLAASGVRTIGVESNPNKLSELQNGRTQVIDSGLQSALRQGVRSRKLEFVRTLSDLPSLELGRRRTFVVTVGTPVESGAPNLEALHDVVESLGAYLRKGDLVALRSTVPIGTTESVARQLERLSGLRVGLDFFVVSAPERTAEGVAMAELRSLPQVVGGVTPRCTEAGREFFSLFARTILIAPNARFSELVKLASNAYRDYTFAFSNFLAQIANGLSVDVNELVRISNLGYERNQIPDPSPGVGGPCLSKDPYMVPDPENLDGVIGINIVRNAREFNEDFLAFQVERIAAEIEGGSSPIAALGLAFKGVPETNDLRGSTGVAILDALKARGLEIHVWDAVFSGEVEGYPPLDEGVGYGAILVLNNHPDNAQMARILLEDCEDDSTLVFDPWRLLEVDAIDGSDNLPGERFTLMTLSTSFKVR